MEEHVDHNVTANLNNAECIKSSNRIGETIYYNICSGSTRAVPWGSMDWFGAVFLALLILVCVSVIVFVFRD